MWTQITTPADALSPARRIAARLDAHWAAQLVAAASASWNPTLADDSHTALRWRADLSVMVGAPIVSAAGWRAGLDIHGFALQVLAPPPADTALPADDTAPLTLIAVFPLAGQTLAAALTWLHGHFSRGHVDVDFSAPQRRDYPLPAHAVAEGGVFPITVDTVALTALSDTFHNAAAALQDHTTGPGTPSPIRIWPHHFDIATLVTLPPPAPSTDDSAGDSAGDAADESGQSVGLGLSPGDEGMPLPYWYVSPWPYPVADAVLPSLPLGRWHTTGFTAAVLAHDEALAQPAGAQAAYAAGYLQGAEAACRAVISDAATKGQVSGSIAADAKPTAAKTELVWFKVAELDELPEGRVKTATCGLDTVCITHFEGRYAALQNACPHQGGPLGEGSIEKGWLRCPWHGWDFHPCTGISPGGYGDGLQTYPVEVREDGVFVGVQQEPAHVETVSDVMARTMTNWGVRWVFGMVGHSNLGLADGLRREVDAGRLGYVGIRHEGAAAFAVSAYGKLTGRPAACLGIAGPGATNLLTGLWDANVDRAPALALTGQVKTQFLGRGAFQEIDQTAAFGKVAQFTATVLHNSQHAELMSLAVRDATLHRGVSHLIFPDEVQNVTDVKPAQGPTGRMPDLAIRPSVDVLQTAAKLIGDAKRPMLIVGHGARESMAEVITFAEALGLPVATTFKAKGQISDHHPLGCGVLGRSGTPVASWMMNESDLLIVLGSSLSNHTGVTSYKPIIHVDFDAATLGRRHAVTLGVLGEIGVTVGLLQEALSEAAFTDVRDEVGQRWQIWRAEKGLRLLEDNGEGISSVRAFAALTRHVPADALMAVDVGNNTYSFGRYFECQGQAVLMSGYLGSIGFGLPAAMGAWAASQEQGTPFYGRKVISVSGDGGLGQYLAELTTLSHYDMDITHVLLNNGQLGKISKEQRAGHWGVWQTSLTNPNFAEFATSCGLLGIRVTETSELDSALARALAHPGPALVEIITDAALI